MKRIQKKLLKAIQSILYTTILGVTFVQTASAQWSVQMYMGPGSYNPSGVYLNSPDIRERSFPVTSQAQWNQLFGSSGNGARAGVGIGVAVAKAAPVLLGAAGIAVTSTFAIDCYLNDGHCIDDAVNEAGGLGEVLFGGHHGAISGTTTVSCSLSGAELLDACSLAVAEMDSGVSGYFSNYTCGEIIEGGRYGSYAAAFDSCFAEALGCVDRTRAVAQANPEACLGSTPNVPVAPVQRFEEVALEDFELP